MSANNKATPKEHASRIWRSIADGNMGQAVPIIQNAIAYYREREDRHLALIATLTEALEGLQACIDFSPTGKWRVANDKATAAVKLAKESGNG